MLFKFTCINIAGFTWLLALYCAKDRATSVPTRIGTLSCKSVLKATRHARKEPNTHKELMQTHRAVSAQPYVGVVRDRLMAANDIANARQPVLTRMDTWVIVIVSGSVIKQKNSDGWPIVLFTHSSDLRLAGRTGFVYYYKRGVRASRGAGQLLAKKHIRPWIPAGVYCFPAVIRAVSQCG